MLSSKGERVYSKEQVWWKPLSEVGVEHHQRILTLSYKPNGICRRWHLSMDSTRWGVPFMAAAVCRSSWIDSRARAIFTARRCISAVFAVARCLSVCLSVLLSCWCIVSTKVKISSNFLFGLVAPSFLFLPQRQFLKRGRKTYVGENFRLQSQLISETVRDRPMHCYGTLIGNQRRQIDPCRFRWLNWVTRNPGFKVTVYLQVEYLKNGAC